MEPGALDPNHGKAPATLRRLASLVEAGLIIRRDSPNGKRFARRGQGGEIESAFGFDLTPLIARVAEIHKLLETHVKQQKRRANESRSERHIQNQITTIPDLEPSLREGRGDPSRSMPKEPEGKGLQKLRLPVQESENPTVADANLSARHGAAGLPRHCRYGKSGEISCCAISSVRRRSCARRLARRLETRARRSGEHDACRRRLDVASQSANLLRGASDWDRASHRHASHRHASRRHASRRNASHRHDMIEGLNRMTLARRQRQASSDMTSTRVVH
jgi:hypothetical protein